MDNQPEEAPSEKIACRRCGESFEFTPPTGPGAEHLRALKPRVCARCAPHIELELAKQRDETEAQERNAERTLFWEKNVPPLYRATEPAKLPPASLPAIRLAVAWEYGPRGLAFVGETRRGKTRTLYLLLHRMLFDHGRRFVAMSAIEFSHRVSRLASDDLPGLDSFLARLCRTSIFFLDDLGKGRMTDRVESELSYVVETRAANLLPVFFTSNSSGNALESTMSPNRGPAFVARLREFCRVETV